MIISLWEDKTKGTRGVSVRSTMEKMNFVIDCKSSDVIEFFDRNRNDEYIQCSSDVNHPNEFGLPDDFDVDIWLKTKLEKVHIKLIDNDMLAVIYNTITKKYSVIVLDVDNVSLTINKAG